jgi:outer membrane protein OmpA-like peptidoglycan-associated protein
MGRVRRTVLGLGFVMALGGAPPAVSAAGSIAAPATAPLSLTSSDGAGLRIVSLHARAEVEDPLAFTELHIVFRNDQPRTIEGQFAITLPPGAAVSRFAMLQAWGWQEGEVVERQAARVAYESFLHRRVDPALLEKQAGNEFRARIFPIPASANKEIVISYSQELAQASQPYRLALRGLPRLDSLDVRVLAGKRAPRPVKTTLGGSAVTHEIVEVKRRDFQPDVDLEVPLPHAAGGLRHDNLAVARVTPVADAASDPPQDLLVLVDTSASRALGFAAEVERLRALIARLAGELGRQAPLRVACFDQGVAAVYAGTLGGFGAKETRAILDRRALGASNLGRALDWAAVQKDRTWTRLLIVTDGVATAGPLEGSELRAKVAALAKAGLQRLDVVAVGGIRNEPTLRALATGGLPRDGAVLDEALPAETVSRRLASATISGIKVAVTGAGWVWPERLDGVQPGDQVLVYADLPAGRPFEVVLSGARTQRQAVATVDAARPLLERAWVGARIQRLEHQRDTLAASDVDLRSALRREIVDLSVRHRVLSDYTALLVLESEQDYARFNIDRRALTDILTIGPTGIDVLRRGDLPGAAFAGGTSVGEPFVGDPRARETTRVAGAEGSMPLPLTGPTGDRDHDGILDDDDGCPDEPETYNGVNDGDGCPDRGVVTIMKGRIEILNAIYFQAGKAEIKPISFPLVDAIAATLNGNPQIRLVEVQGHTARGEKDRLATNRANAVVKALGERNVDRIRLVARAYGNTKPICIQKGEACLSKNRRVEFLIVPRDDKTEWFSEPVPRPWNKSTPPPPPPPPPRVAPVPDQERRFAEAMALLKAGKPEQARSAAQSWRDQRPADVLALLALGAAAEATGDLPLAARAYGSLIDLFPAQADDRRLAGERLEHLGGDALALAVDTYRQARAQRPDQPSSHRLLAYALVRAGQPAAALDIALEGVRQTYPADRFAAVGPILREDAGIIAAAAIRQNPGTRENIMRRLSAAGVGLATGRSLRFVLSWETDASDVDLHVKDGKGGIAWYSQPKLESGGRLYADVTTGYGPECFAIDGTPAAYPYALSVTYYNQGPTGYGLGRVQVIEHDGSGQLRFDDRPFVLLENRGQQDLGTVRGPLHGS